MAKVLLIDDEMTMMQVVGEVLRCDGHQVIPFTNSTAAVDRLGAVSPDLVIAHLGPERMRASGAMLLQKARASNPPALVLMILPSGGLEVAMEAMKRGAYDYLAKPFTLDELKLRVQRALSYQATLCENVLLRKQIRPETQGQELIGRSPRMQDIIKTADQAADSESTVLITGESGTGKQLLARTIHLKSRRRLAPFIAVKCAGTSEFALEAELFGSATGDRCGALREAEGGTVFLNDIGSLSPALQDRLLDALKNRAVQSPTEDTPVGIDVRIITASHPALEQTLADGALRRDLHQRLSEISIAVPVLRERAEDIPLLIAQFLQGKIHPRSGKSCVITAAALELCRSYSWPGNIEELQTALEQSVLVSKEGCIEPADLPRAVQQLNPPAASAPVAIHRNGHSHPEPSQVISQAHRTPIAFQANADLAAEALVPLKKFLRDQEISYLQKTLAQVGGSKERAAELLGISLATIYRKLSEPEPVTETV